MRKKLLFSAVAATFLGSGNANADIAITNMFAGDNYTTSGTLLSAGGGQVNSVDLFFGPTGGIRIAKPHGSCMLKDIGGIHSNSFCAASPKPDR